MTSTSENGALRRKLGAVIQLTNREVDCLDSLLGKVATFPAGAAIVQEGENYERSHVVRQGWAIRYKTLSDGRRQILNFALPGDFVGLFAPLFEAADHSVTALTDLETHPIDSGFLVDIFGACPRLGAAVAWSAGRDEAMLSEQVVRVGRRSAYERTGHLIVELLHRLRLVGKADRESFDLPLTQEVLADTLGLSTVHVNRTLRRLRENGLLHITGDRVIIRDLQKLVDVTDFSPDYLVPRPLPRATENVLASA